MRGSHSFELVGIHPIHPPGVAGFRAVVGEGHVYEHGVHAHDVAGLELVRDGMHHVLEHFSGSAALGNKLIREARERVRHLRYHLRDVLLELVGEDRNAHDAIVGKVEVVPEVRAILIVRGGAVQTAVGFACFGQFHHHAHMHQGGNEYPLVVRHKVALVLLHQADRAASFRPSPQLRPFGPWHHPAGPATHRLAACGRSGSGCTR